MPLAGGDGLEDGFRFLRDTMRIATAGANEVVQLRAGRDGETLDIWLGSNAPFELWRATAPGAPGKGDARFILFRSTTSGGTVHAVWSWSGLVKHGELFPFVATTMEHERHEFAWVDDGLRVTIIAGKARSTIDLAPGVLGTPGDAQLEFAKGDRGGQTDDEPRRAVVLKPHHPVHVVLGEESYRRSEDSWEEAGEPTADITLANENGGLMIEVAVSNVDRTFVLSGTANRLDNEQADVNGAGIQLYLRTDEARAGYVLVPQHSRAVEIRPIDGWGAGLPAAATWTDTEGGYVVEILVPRLASGTVIDVDVIVNEKPLGRERRRGQLILSGGAGEFAYLRGDRHDADRLIPLLLTDA
jgi:hypothetical protein